MNVQFAIDNISAFNPGMFDSSLRLWHMTVIFYDPFHSFQSTCNFNSFPNATSYLLLSRPHPSALLLILTTSASGIIIPPVFIVRATSIKDEWFLPFPSFTDNVRHERPYPGPMHTSFPSTSLVLCTENFLSFQQFMPQILHHSNKFIRSHVPIQHMYCLLTDIDFSASDVSAIDICRNNNYELLKISTYSRTISKYYILPLISRLNDSIIHYKSMLYTDLDIISADLSIRLHLMLAILSMTHISSSDVRQFFTDLRLWPIPSIFFT